MFTFANCIAVFNAADIKFSAAAIFSAVTFNSLMETRSNCKVIFFIAASPPAITSSIIFRTLSFNCAASMEGRSIIDAHSLRLGSLNTFIIIKSFFLSALQEFLLHLPVLIFQLYPKIHFQQ